MKRSDELWGWIWEDEDPLAAALNDLMGEEAGRPTALLPPPRGTTEEVWEWVASDEEVIDRDVLDLPEEPLPASPEREAPGPARPSGPVSWVDLLSPPEPEVEPEPEPELEVVEAVRLPELIRLPAAPEQEAEPHREPRRAWGRRGRFLALLAVMAVVGAVAPRVAPVVLPGPAPAAPGPPPDQVVVAWTIRMEQTPGATFVAVLASGARPPVAVAVPAAVTINVPGQGLGTVGEAAAGGDAGLVEVALENLLGVPIDASIWSDGKDLQAGVDALGTIEVADQPLNGGQALQYLTTVGPAALPDEPFLRWQDVLDGVLRAVAVHPEAVAAFPEALRPVLEASSPEPADLYALPVIELGADLVRPDQKALDRFVEQHFLPSPTDEVRLVVLNGVGTPGVGEEVARILVPEGYRLMSSTNANTFDVRTTKLIASSGDDLGSAERARDLLGVGQVFLGFSRLADVTIVVGRDFVASHHLGGA